MSIIITVANLQATFVSASEDPYHGLLIHGPYHKGPLLIRLPTASAGKRA